MAICAHCGAVLRFHKHKYMGPAFCSRGRSPACANAGAVWRRRYVLHYQEKQTELRRAHQSRHRDRIRFYGRVFVLSRDGKRAIGPW